MFNVQQALPCVQTMSVLVLVLVLVELTVLRQRWGPAAPRTEAEAQQLQFG